jgi:hypothetical protein
MEKLLHNAASSGGSHLSRDRTLILEQAAQPKEKQQRRGIEVQLVLSKTGRVQ